MTATFHSFCSVQQNGTWESISMWENNFIYFRKTQCGLDKFNLDSVNIHIANKVKCIRLNIEPKWIWISCISWKNFNTTIVLHTLPLMWGIPKEFRVCNKKTYFRRIRYFAVLRITYRKQLRMYFCTHRTIAAIEIECFRWILQLQFLLFYF